MKVCQIDTTDWEYCPSYIRLRERTSEMTRRSDTNAGYKAATPALDWINEVTCTYFHLLLSNGIVEKMIETESAGYEAAITGCYFDHGLQQAREIMLS